LTRGAGIRRKAVDLLAEYQDEASVLAGGQSLIPLLALRLARPAVLVDINKVPELSGISSADRWALGSLAPSWDGCQGAGEGQIARPGPAG
jgi:CO/xanthine dehydrogenase FAD-binding subunit